MRQNKNFKVFLGLCLLSLAAVSGCKNEAALYDSAQVQEELLEEGKEAAGEVPEASGGPSEAAKEEKAAPFCVYVCGEVAEPGLYEFSEGARIADAVEAAGGMTAQAADSYLNLAEYISDGQKIEVPSKEEAGAEKKLLEEAALGLVNLNTASEQELMELPGIGASKAREIVNYRESSGGFSRIEDLMEIPGIKEGVFNKIKDQITV